VAGQLRYVAGSDIAIFPDRDGDEEADFTGFVL